MPVNTVIFPGIEGSGNMSEFDADTDIIVEVLDSRASKVHTGKILVTEGSAVIEIPSLSIFVRSESLGAGHMSASSFSAFTPSVYSGKRRRLGEIHSAVTKSTLARFPKDVLDVVNSMEQELRSKLGNDNLTLTFTTSADDPSDVSFWQQK